MVADILSCVQSSTCDLVLKCDWHWIQRCSKSYFARGHNNSIRRPGPCFDEIGIDIFIIRVWWPRDRLIFVMEIHTYVRWNHLYRNSPGAQSDNFVNLFQSVQSNSVGDCLICLTRGCSPSQNEYIVENDIITKSVQTNMSEYWKIIFRNWKDLTSLNMSSIKFILLRNFCAIDYSQYSMNISLCHRSQWKSLLSPYH